MLQWHLIKTNSTKEQNSVLEVCLLCIQKKDYMPKYVLYVDGSKHKILLFSFLDFSLEANWKLFM